jgi:TPP-dependent pyruvate/acetoin dehydrogenase alpha subunit
VQARDPIPQLKRIMLEQGLATEDDIKAIHDRSVHDGDAFDL